MNPSSPSLYVRLAERSYPIYIGPGVLPSLGSLAGDLLRPVHAAIIADQHVEQYAMRAAESLAAADVAVDVMLVEPGESSKSVETAAQLWNKLLELGADRKSIVVAVGGGVVGDLAGFVAATFARGLPLVQVPTTLLAQVDSSVGGKVAVNLPGAKNMVGSFWQPKLVLIDTDTLGTLPDREYRAGLAEVVKYGVILDAEFFDYLEANVAELNRRESAVLEHVVARCCRLKADVVEQDEREETGIRSVLNFGHTFCHALEAVGGYSRWLHGEAVSVGMVWAALLAQRLGRVDDVFTRRLHDLLAALRLPVSPGDVDAESLLAAMSHDKKVERGRLRFVLPTRLGHVELVDGVESDDVREVLETRSMK